MPICFSYLKLKPWEMDAMTPGEILDCFDGWKIRWRRQEELIAWLVTIPIYNHQRGEKDKQLTMRDIFGAKEYTKRFSGRIDRPTKEELMDEILTER